MIMFMMCKCWCSRRWFSGSGGQCLSGCDKSKFLGGSDEGGAILLLSFLGRLGSTQILSGKACRQDARKAMILFFFARSKRP